MTLTPFSPWLCLACGVSQPEDIEEPVRCCVAPRQIRVLVDVPDPQLAISEIAAGSPITQQGGTPAMDSTNTATAADAPPWRTAMDKANTIRLQRIALRQRVEAKRASMAESMAELALVLEERHPCLQTAPLWTVLGWPKYAGGVAIGRMLAQADIRNQYRAVGSLTDRQIDVLTVELRRRLEDARLIAAAAADAALAHGGVVA